METLEQKIRKNAVTNGLIFGVIFLVITIFSFYYVTSMTSSMLAMFIVPLLVTFLGGLGIATWLSFDLRKKIGGYWSFKQATTGIFIMFIVGYALNALGSYGFRVLVEPDMVQKMETVMVNGTAEAMKSRGSNQDAIDKQVDDVRSKFEEQKDMTIGKFAKSTAIAIILNFVFAIVFGALFKKEPLRYATDAELLDGPSTDPTV